MTSLFVPTTVGGWVTSVQPPPGALILDVRWSTWSSEPRHLKTAIGFLRDNRDRFPFAQMVSHRFHLKDANEALATTAAWKSAKSVLVPSGA